MKMRALKIGIYKGFKRVAVTNMITALDEKEAIAYCKQKFTGRNCKIEKDKLK